MCIANLLVDGQETIGFEGGLNYRNHARESMMDVPSSPLLFGKFDNALA